MKKSAFRYLTIATLAATVLGCGEAVDTQATVDSADRPEANEAYTRRFNVRVRNVTNGTGPIEEKSVAQFASLVVSECTSNTNATVYGDCTALNIDGSVPPDGCPRATCTAAGALCVANRMLDLADVPGTTTIQAGTTRYEVPNQTAEARLAIFGGAVEYIRRAAQVSANTLADIGGVGCGDTDVVERPRPDRG